MNERKRNVVSFKVEEELQEALEKLPNKSEFIRAAVLNALSDTCPLCGGSGFLNEKQRMHWQAFLQDHKVLHCKRCNGLEIECSHSKHHNHHEEECCQ